MYSHTEYIHTYQREKILSLWPRDSLRDSKNNVPGNF